MDAARCDPTRASARAVHDTNGTDACVFPAALVAGGVDGVLYTGPQSTATGSPHRAGLGFQRKPPYIDLAREFHVSGSYHDARATIDALTKRHRRQQLAAEECFDRDIHATKFTTQFAEARLGTCGVPTLNTVGVLIDRQRSAASNQRERATPPRRATTSERVQDAVRRVFGSQTLDLMALELVRIPDQEVYTTMLMQLARLVRCVNVSRNALREIPSEFCDAFPDVDALVYKENALDTLPPSLAALQYLQTLNVECNQLVALPLHLPSSLEVLRASRNRLAHVSNLHELTQLRELDLSHNHFQVPPNGLQCLTKLTFLTLSGNRLVTLALPLKVTQGTSTADRTARSVECQPSAVGADENELLDPEQAKKRWRVQVDPETQDTVYFHVATKTVTRIKPTCFQIRIPKLQLTSVGSTATLGTHRSLTKGRTAKASDAAALETSFPGGWEIRVSESASTDVAFVNHLDANASTVNTIPPALDRLGDLTNLHTLCVSGNQLLDLPPSIGKLVRLKRLEAEHNKLLALPDTLQDMQALQTLKLGMNALSWLPDSLTKLANLTDLDLKLNRFQHLPERFGALSRLEMLDVSANALESLPRSFLELKKLASLKLQNNPRLVRSSGGGGFRPETLATGDIEQVMWQLAHELQCERHGSQPPVPTSHVVGVGDERWSTDIHLHKEFAHAIAVAAAAPAGVLAFHWKNLTLAQFPSTFFSSLASLRELRLSGHNLDVVPSSFAALVSLRVLQLRKNRIRELADDVFVRPNSDSDSRSPATSELVELDLEHNLLETLPTSIGSLVKLRVLKAANNRLRSLPDSISRLDSELRDVSLAHNLFEHPPTALGSLLRLERLNLSSNRLVALDPMDFTYLRCLRSLRVNANQLEALPESVGTTPLEELWIAGNRFAAFPPAVLELKPTLTSLCMQSNKLSRLPVEFGELARLDDVQADGNPFKSPPPEVMNLGIRCIRAYLLKRQERVREVTELLTMSRFPVDPSSFCELKVCRLVTWAPLGASDTAKRPESKAKTRSRANDAEPPTSLRFLTRTHLATFDAAVDQYVNGTFYLLDARGADLVNDLLLKTQFAVAQRHRELVLADLLQLCRLVQVKRWADKVDFRYDCDRPWGRRGELVAVYLLNPAIVYERSGSGSGLPSLLDVIETRVCHGFEAEAFTRTYAEVQDAVEHFVGPYGPIGVVHDNLPFKCGCEALLRIHKMHAPCYRPGWAFVQVVYSEEEAARRTSDEAAIADAMRALRPQIETFLRTAEGEKRFHTEVKAIKDTIRRELKSLKLKLGKARKRLKARAASLKTKSVQADGTARDDAVEDVRALEARVKAWAAEYEQGKARLSAGYAAFLDAVVAALLERVGAQVQSHLVQQQRQRALERGWRRPWDGRNGSDFEAYKRAVRRQLLAGSTATPQTDDRTGADGEEMEEEGDERVSDNSEISDVSFEGYEDLVQAAVLGRDAAGATEEEDDDDDDDDDERDAALANLVVSDVSDDDNHDAGVDAKHDDSDDSDI